MGGNANGFWRTADGRPTRALRLVALAAALAAVTGLDLLLYGRPNPWSYAIALIVFVAVGYLLEGQERTPGTSGRWVPPGRLPLGRARVVAGLGVSSLVLAAAGLLVPDRAEGAVTVALFVAAGLGNLAWGVGSLLPDDRRARALRLATFPLAIAMLLAMAAWVALQVSGRL